ncbi:MAG: DUF3343 domain-containing protein [Thermodesulfobacteriota bacterium]|nr:DUF3343 domain-containing protein [Thermodesulfobacteriota bacterium]
MKISRFFSKKSQKHGKRDFRALLVYSNTSEVIRAEKVLKKNGYKIRVVGPPPHLRTGCDLVIEFPIIEQLGIEHLLNEHGFSPLEIVAISGDILEPVELCQKKDFKDYLMIRAANMKLVIDKRTEEIVNISGGGCPDVPYLAEMLIGKKLKDAPSPRDIGHTICAYALHVAYEEMLKEMDSYAAIGRNNTE